MDITWPPSGALFEQPSLVGRDFELHALASWASSQHSDAFFVVGERGIGKTALVRHFELLNDELFVGGIFNISATRGIDQVYQLELGAGRSLVFVDDIDLLKPNTISELLSWNRGQESVKLILSGRELPKLECIGKYLDRVISLKNIDPIKIIESRFQGGENSKLNDQLIDAALNNEELFDRLLGTPRATLTLADKLMSAKDRQQTQINNPPLPQNIRVDQTSNDFGQYDYYGYMLAFIFFIWSYISSTEMEERITNEIHDASQIVAEAFENQKIIGNHVVTTFVNFRTTAKEHEDNIITVLAPNQQINLIDVENG